MKAVEANIENQWNNKYKIKGSDGKTYGAQVDVTFDGPFNQTVKVDPGENGVDGKRSSINLWHWGDGAGINAHEFGHMLGLFDEYTGGWLDPSQSPPLIDDKALMGRGCLGKNPTMPERYYTQFSDYLHKLNDGYTFTLVTIPRSSRRSAWDHWSWAGKSGEQTGCVAQQGSVNSCRHSIRDPVCGIVQSASVAVSNQAAPTPGAFAIALTQRDQVLLATRIRAIRG